MVGIAFRDYKIGEVETNICYMGKDINHPVIIIDIATREEYVEWCRKIKWYDRICWKDVNDPQARFYKLSSD